MRVAIPTWKQDVSPVLDVAGRMLLVDVEDKTEQARRFEALDGESLLSQADGIKNMAVDVVICGAVSWVLEEMLRSAGMEVVPHVCGPVEEVLSAYLDGRLDDPCLQMPGCETCPERRRARCNAARWSSGNGSGR